MPYAMFHTYFPEIAERETLVVTVFPSSPFDLPPGRYALLEMFCDEPGCDCRRVMFYVMLPHSKEAGAIIVYGWESRQFYARWLGDDDPLVLDDWRVRVL